MPVYPYEGRLPSLGRGTWIAPDAVVTGDVTTGEDVSFWFQTVTRGDVNRITIGDTTNIQDGSILHVTHETHPLVIGRRVVVGHAAVLHGCTIEDGALIGIGARVLDGAIVEAGAQIAAGAVVVPGSRVPSGWMAMGIPAKPTRRLSDVERQTIGEIADRYRRLKSTYADALDGTAEAAAETDTHG